MAGVGAVDAQPAVSGRVLGVDPGTRVVGYAILDVPNPGRFDYVECGVLAVPARDELSARLLELATSLREIIEEFRPAGLAIERAFHGINAASALKLAEARGALKLVALEHGLAVSEYAPAMIKRAVVGRGRATKVEVQARVRLLCRLGTTPKADAADALAIAICHVQASRLPNIERDRRADLRRQLARRRRRGSR
ncbi:Crossover junction endodeoxyribonuclease RuvC [Enhygromyxa salina]|uniref:Crossover junction endodeoxyribonuclease RuvC n=1 Tax=Enhygromyxa salina TaxID=215803 RepID=A0A2S9YL85_9BACT|nr:crossover junction endodeoxyribonuclease RuvC [Enhygromyxa salina]PRQ05867.1 Crossover junction endodeoxyribonuclease RuvC [Enhygromyxa salina]